jgi:uncharacterized oxidoreductase
MRTDGNTILITGGATGIGFALAEAFVKAGNKVLICGRREAKLKEARAKLPQIQTRQCDLSKKEDRESFCDWVKDNHEGLNILVNNAGIQRAINLRKGITELFGGEDEVQINFAAPIHLSAYFAPLLLKKKEAAIINVSSGLGFVPIAAMPVYCATKAGIHMFTISLRHQLKDSPVRVFEVVPPAVDTELGKGTTGESEQQYRGIPPSEVAVATLKALENDQYEIVIGEAKGLVEGSKKDFERAFKDSTAGDDVSAVAAISPDCNLTLAFAA